jgi:AcrR family transcriptional regulator
MEPAPARGCYDRALTRGQRQAEQHARLLRATAEVFDGSRTTVAAIVKHASVSRNTFYEHFDDIEHALCAASAQGAELLFSETRARLGETRTPIEGLRALARRWFQALDDEPHFARIALDASLAADPSTLSQAGRALERLLAYSVTAARSFGALSLEAAGVRLSAVAAAAEHVSRARMLGRVDAETARQILVDLIIRVFH